MLDQLSMFSDELTELLLAEEPVPAELIHRVLRRGDDPQYGRAGAVRIGAGWDRRAAGAGRRGRLSAQSGRRAAGRRRRSEKAANAAAFASPIADEPFCGLVFKIQADRHGDLHYVRVYSGVLKANSRVYNPGKDKKENVPQLWRVQADRRNQVEAASAGDIVGVIGLRHSVTGDTLCSTQEPILLESITFPETVISMAIEPETSTERKKLADVLEMMKRQDPTFRARENEETGQTLISGMGELHLEVIKHRLLRDFRLNVRVHKPRVSYRETIERAVEVTGECHRNVGGQMLSAKVRIRMEPFSKGMKAGHGASVAPGGILPEEFLAAAVEVLERAGRRGRHARLPVDARENHRPRRRGSRDGLQRVGLPLCRRRCLRKGAPRGGHRALGADHAAGSDRARGTSGRHRGRSCSSGGRSSSAPTPAAATR